jgi:hypothetical protein
MSGLIRSGMMMSRGGRRPLGVVMACRHTSAREYNGLFMYSYVYKYARSIYVEDKESKGKRRKGKSLAFTAMSDKKMVAYTRQLFRATGPGAIENTVCLKGACWFFDGVAPCLPLLDPRDPWREKACEFRRIWVRLKA